MSNIQSFICLISSFRIIALQPLQLSNQILKLVLATIFFILNLFIFIFNCIKIYFLCYFSLPRFTKLSFLLRCLLHHLINLLYFVLLLWHLFLIYCSKHHGLMSRHCVSYSKTFMFIFYWIWFANIKIVLFEVVSSISPI